MNLDELYEIIKNDDLPELTEELFSLFETEGNRVRYEAVYFERRKHLAVFGLIAIREHKLSDKLIHVIDEICKEETWALPAHCNRAKDSDWRHTVDLFSCETACALSIIYNDLKDLLPDETKTKMQDEVYKRVLSPFFYENKVFGWEGANHNWNAVCAGSIGVSVLYMNCLSDIEKALQRINKSLDSYISKGFAEDGACLEGMGYYNYGFSFFTGYATRLFEYSEGKIDLLANEKIKRIAEFPKAIFTEKGISVNFSDATTHEKLYRGMTKLLENRFGIKYNVPEKVYAEFDSDSCFRFITLYDDMMSYKPQKSPSEPAVTHNKPTKRVCLLEAAQWLICENERGYAFAIKGGHNNEPHNHNDVGSYLLCKGEEIIVSDLGSGVYTKDYFGAGRYNILCCSSLGHSLPVINGEGQKQGEQHKASDFSVVEADDKVTVHIDMTKAYDIDGVQSVCRTAVFDMGEDAETILTVEDIVETDKDFRITDLHTRIISKHPLEQWLFASDFSVDKDIFVNHGDQPEEVLIYKVPFVEDKQNQGAYRHFISTYSFAEKRHCKCADRI